MDAARQDIKEFIVRRRCDNCGTKIVLVAEANDKCLLICRQCGREYIFYAKAAQNFK